MKSNEKENKLRYLLHLSNSGVVTQICLVGDEIAKIVTSPGTAPAGTSSCYLTRTLVGKINKYMVFCLSSSGAKLGSFDPFKQTSILTANKLTL